MQRRARVFKALADFGARLDDLTEKDAGWGSGCKRASGRTKDLADLEALDIERESEN